MLIPTLMLAAHAGTVFVDVSQAQRLVVDGAAVLDARGEGAWVQGHVPASWPVDWLAHREGHLRTGLLTHDVASLELTLEAAGVRDDAPVVVIGAGPDGWGEEGRWFWTLEYLGHPRVVVVDGGWPAWIAAGGATTTARTRPEPGDFTPREQVARRVRLDDVVRASQTGSALVWDTREDSEYAGATPYGEARGGHIPGAAGLWYGELLGPDGQLLPEDALRSLLLSRGIRPGQPIITACTGGVRSGFAYAVLRDLGYPQVANYDGSMWEWSGDERLPLTTARPSPPPQ